MEGLAASAGFISSDAAGRVALVAYLNGEARGNTNVTTTFSAARSALNRLAQRLPSLRWGWSTTLDTFELTIPGHRQPTVVDKKSRGTLSSSLRLGLQLQSRTTLNAKPDQGRAARVVTTSPTSNHFLHGGRFTRFADWRFIHRARLNVLPLNGCRRWGEGDRRCRRCGSHDETTAHVLCHCLPAMPAITRRHNAILDLLVKGLRRPATADVRVDQTVPLSTLVPGCEASEMMRLRPDLVIIDEPAKSIQMVDVTVPYEDGWQSVVMARQRKIDKYSPLADVLRNAGYDVSVQALVVGSLGAWDSANWATMRHLGISRRFGGTLARRCVSEAIKWSRDIYTEHVSGSRQY